MTKYQKINLLLPDAFYDEEHNDEDLYLAVEHFYKTNLNPDDAN